MRLLQVTLLTVLVPVMGLAGRAQSGYQEPGFAPFQETTIDGIVERIDDAGSDDCEMCQACADCTGTHLVLVKKSARIVVHLAPAWFLDRNGFVFAPGDVVSVTGSRMHVGLHHGMCAREVRRGREVMRFRDERGLPLWRRELTSLERPGGDEGPRRAS